AHVGMVTVRHRVPASTSAPRGAGMFNLGEATVRDSTSTGNSAGSSGGGIDNVSGTVTVIDSTFTDNSAGGNGGGIDNRGFGGTVTVIDSTFTGNSARHGGSIFNARLVSRVQVFPSTLTVSASTFAGNTATNHGGGIDNFGTATVSGSTFTGNTAGSGNGGLNNEAGGLLTQFDNQFIDDQAPDVFA